MINSGMKMRNTKNEKKERKKKPSKPKCHVHWVIKIDTKPSMLDKYCMFGPKQKKKKSIH